MSDPLRIALVAEGPTDGVVIEAALRSMLNTRPFVVNQIFPEGSTSFGELGTGWVGIYRWCRQSAKRGNGQLQTDALVYAICFPSHTPVRTSRGVVQLVRLSRHKLDSILHKTYRARKQSRPADICLAPFRYFG